MASWKTESLAFQVPGFFGLNFRYVPGFLGATYLVKMAPPPFVMSRGYPLGSISSGKNAKNLLNSQFLL